VPCYLVAREPLDWFFPRLSWPPSPGQPRFTVFTTQHHTSAFMIRKFRHNVAMHYSPNFLDLWFLRRWLLNIKSLVGCGVRDITEQRGTSFFRFENKPRGPTGMPYERGRGCERANRSFWPLLGQEREKLPPQEEQQHYFLTCFS
jgi:hypothetical protein